MLVNFTIQKAVFLNKATIATSKTALPVNSELKAAPNAGKKQTKLTSFVRKTEALVSDNSASITQTNASADTANATSDAANATDNQTLLQLQNVSFDFEDVERKFSGEGRTITVELNNVIIVACYVPNSGKNTTC